MAVAASISCLFALVNTLTAALNKSVKSIIRAIFRVRWPGTTNNIAEGPTRRPTVVRVRMSRTRTSIRYLLIKWRFSSSLLRYCSLEVKSI